MKSNRLFIDKPFEVANELEALGLDREGLLDAIDKIVTVRNNCTKNDVPAARGTQAYFTGTRVLRETYCPRGWIKCEDGGMACIFHPETLIKVIMVNTDDATGLNIEGRSPENRNRKGPTTDLAVSLNKQLYFEGFEVAENIIRLDEKGGIQHWFLMVYAEGDVVRAELSYPETFQGGFFKAFRKRIILIGVDEDSDGAKARNEEPDGDLDIPVTRKQG